MAINPDVIKEEDTYRFTTTLENPRTGTTYDLTDATEVRLYVDHLRSDTLVVNSPVEIVDAANGEVAYDFSRAETARAGTHRAEFVVEETDGDYVTVPNDGYVKLDFTAMLPRGADLEPATADTDATVATLTATDWIESPVARLDSVTTDETRTDSLHNTGRDLSTVKQAASDGVWTWFHEPRAVHYNGKTYVGWIARDGSVEVGAYDHSAGSWTRTTLNSQFQEDDHDNPTVLVANDGKIWCFYSKHGAESTIYYKVSSNAEDVSSFGTEQTITTAASTTYPSPFQYSDGTIDVFHRAGSDYYRARSTDGGSTWSTTQITNDASHYVKPIQDGDTIHFGFTVGGHPRLTSNPDTSHFKYVKDSGFQNTDGSGLTLPFGGADTITIWDVSAEGEKAWIHDCAVDSNGNPAVVFATFPREWGHHAYHYAKWTGSSWTVNKVTDAGSYITNDEEEEQYSAGACLDPKDPSTVYAAVGGNRSSKIQRWETTDDGSTWSYRDVVGAQQQNIRPTCPVGYHDDLRLLWCRGAYRHYAYQAYDMEVLGGDGTQTASVDMPTTPVNYDRGCRLTRSTDVTISSGAWANVDWETEDYDKGGWWDSGQSSAYAIYVPEWGVYSVTFRAYFPAVSAAGTFSLQLFDSVKTLASNVLLDEQTAASGDDVLLEGTIKIPADGAPDNSQGRFIARVYQDTGSGQTLSSAAAEIQQHSP